MHNRTILLADDEVNLRTLVRTTLEEQECRILEASDGTTALELAVREHPDLILLDWMMPGLTGVEIVKKLRSDPALSSVPVILLTARGQAKDRALAESLGILHYMVKPFSPLQLLDKVQEALGLDK